MDTALTTEEQTRLATLCATVHAGLATFVEVGAALLEIRESKLYRARCSTFEAFVQVEFQVSRARAYQLIGAAAVVENLSTTVDTTPASEWVARPLAELPPEQQKRAWTEAVTEAAAEGVKVTAAAVQRAVDKIRKPKARKPKHESAEDMAAAIVGKRPAPEPDPAPSQTSEPEPEHPVLDPASEWERAERECERLRALVESLKGGKLESEYAALSEKHARLNGRLQQEIASHGEAVKEAKYAKAMLAKIRLALGVQADAAILPAIKALQP